VVHIIRVLNFIMESYGIVMPIRMVLRGYNKDTAVPTEMWELFSERLGIHKERGLCTKLNVGCNNWIGFCMKSLIFFQENWRRTVWTARR
jgi:hypothetical protein